MYGEIVDYKAVSESNSDLLTHKVNQLIKRGYVPIGGVSVSNTYDKDDWKSIELHSQSMVRYKEVVEPKEKPLGFSKIKE